MPSARFDNGQYPGPYYHVLHLFVSDHPIRSVLAMRLANGALAVVLTVVTLVLAEPPLRRTVALSVLASWVPLGLFLVTSVNPSGWSVAGVSTYWCLLVTLLLTDRSRRRVVSISLGVAVSGFVAVVSRADAAAYILVSTAAVVLLVWPPRDRWPRLAVSSLVCAAALGVVLTSGQADVISSGIQAESLGRTGTSLLFVNLTEFPELVAGALGTWGLGWLDTDMPAITWFSTIGAFCSLIVLGLSSAPRRKLAAVALVVAALVAAPVQVLIEGQDYVGESVQPRYLLPMLPVVLGLSLVQRGGRGATVIRPGQARLICGALIVAHAFALHANLRRYVTGQDVRAFNLDHGREWWWWASPGPMLVWAVGTAAFGFVAWSLLLRRDSGPAEIDATLPIEVGSRAPDHPPRPKVDADPAWQ